MPYGRTSRKNGARTANKPYARRQPRQTRQANQASPQQEKETWQTVRTKNIPLPRRGFVNVRISESSTGRKFAWLRRGYFDGEGNPRYWSKGQPIPFNIDLGDYDALTQFIGELILASGLPLEGVVEYVESEGDYDDE